METFQITLYSTKQSNSAPDEFVNALHDSLLRYSMRHIILAGITSQENIMDALQKAMQICLLAGVNVRHHFRQVFVFDKNTGTTHTDWLMSKKGLNLIIMQSPVVNEQIARWLFELAEE
ncbi:MAG: hypothetical protein SH857_06715 [Chitinophagales bacterium]|nr:hypothetical protein [Chitinophagales bacterium]